MDLKMQSKNNCYQQKYPQGWLNIGTSTTNIYWALVWG